METAIERVRAFVKDRDWDQFHTPDNLAKSICIEAGELLECFQWDPEKYEHRAVCEELADVMIYCMQLADKLQVNMEDIILDKMEKNEKKYPVEKARGNAAKYDAYEYTGGSYEKTVYFCGYRRNLGKRGLCTYCEEWHRV